MGCASSTPMIATAKSDMLKAASHVAEDVSKKAEDTVHDVTETLGKTIDTAKDTVGTAVTGIANDLSHTISEKTEALGEAKNQLMGKLHLGSVATAATEQLKDSTATAPNESDTDEELTKVVNSSKDAVERMSRAPTPAHDVDSLKTTTPEPEIEQALANHSEDSPPTPKPTLSELEKLKTEVAANGGGEEDKAAQKVHELPTANEPPGDNPKLGDDERPSTTEWEKYADTLGKLQKKFYRFGQQYNPPPPPLAPPTVGAAYANPTGAIHHQLIDDDSCFSDAYYSNSVSSPSQASQRSSARAHRGRLPRGSHATAAITARKMQREYSSFAGFRKALGAANTHMPHAPPLSPPAVTGRSFDFNPTRSRITASTAAARSAMHTRAGSPLPVVPMTRSGVNTAIKTRIVSLSRVNSPIKSRKRAPGASSPEITGALSSQAPTACEESVQAPPHAQLQQQTHPGSPTKLKSRSHSSLKAAPHAEKKAAMRSGASSPTKARSLSRSSRSTSTSNSVVIKSSHSSPRSLTPSKSSLPEMDATNFEALRMKLDFRALTPTRLDYGMQNAYAERRASGIDLQRSPHRACNTSSFLSSPRCSPFSIRKDYMEYSDKENKAVFNADLSSVVGSRSLLTPSPYKIRARCAVCYNKYVIK